MLLDVILLLCIALVFKLMLTPTKPASALVDVYESEQPVPDEYR